MIGKRDVCSGRRVEVFRKRVTNEGPTHWKYIGGEIGSSCKKKKGTHSKDLELRTKVRGRG